MLFSFKDHECSGKSTKAMSDAAKAAIARQERQNQNQGIAKYFQRQQVVNPPPRPNAAQIQGNLSEDEALGKTLIKDQHVMGRIFFKILVQKYTPHKLISNLNVFLAFSSYI